MVKIPITHTLRSNMNRLIPLDVYFHTDETMCMQLTRATIRVDLGVVGIILT